MDIHTILYVYFSRPEYSNKTCLFYIFNCLYLILIFVKRNHKRTLISSYYQCKIEHDETHQNIYLQKHINLNIHMYVYRPYMNLYKRV